MAQTYTWDVQITGDEVGACCVGTTCSQTTQANCTGTFKGVGVSCTPNPCETGTGACCVDGVCSIKTEANCTGTFKGVDTTCSPDPCGGTACDQQTSQSACETAGCYWYAYPNPFGEQTCHGKPIYIQYLPMIAVGIGALAVVAFLLSGKKQTSYYPPPMYYPPYPGGR